MITDKKSAVSDVSESRSQPIQKNELLSFQEQARQIEAEKNAKRKERERRKREKELKKRREQQAKLVGPVLLIITVLISALIYAVAALFRN